MDKAKSKMDACLRAMENIEMPCSKQDIVDRAVLMFGPMTSEYGNPIGIQDVRNALLHARDYSCDVGGPVCRVQRIREGDVR